MKSKYVYVSVLTVLSIILTGCAGIRAEKGSSDLLQRESVAAAMGGNSQQISADEAKNIAFGSEAESMVVSASTTTIASTPSTTKSTTVTTKAMLSRAEAKALALARANVAENEIFDYEIELDYDDDTRRWEYEISFDVGRTEFECEIHAEDGTILYFKTDIDD